MFKTQRGLIWQNPWGSLWIKTHLLSGCCFAHDKLHLRCWKQCSFRKCGQGNACSSVNCAVLLPRGMEYLHQAGLTAGEKAPHLFPIALKRAQNPVSPPVRTQRCHYSSLSFQLTLASCKVTPNFERCGQDWEQDPKNGTRMHSKLPSSSSISKFKNVLLYESFYALTYTHGYLPQFHLLGLSTQLRRLLYAARPYLEASRTWAISTSRLCKLWYASCADAFWWVAVSRTDWTDESSPGHRHTLGRLADDLHSTISGSSCFNAFLFNLIYLRPAAF